MSSNEAADAAAADAGGGVSISAEAEAAYRTSGSYAGAVAELTSRYHQRATELHETARRLGQLAAQISRPGA